MVIALQLVILKLEVRYGFPVSLVLNYMAQEKEPAWKAKNGVAL